MKKTHMIELTIDDKKFRTEAKNLRLKIDDLLVYKLPRVNAERKSFQTTALRSLLQSANAAFGHDERFEIMRSLAESPKTFSELKNIFGMPSPTLDYHLKKLTNEWILYKEENGRYTVTLLGQLLLTYFAKFLEEASKLQESMGKEE